MPLSHELQNLASDVSAKIAANQRLGRADLEVLRRNLTELARSAGKMERDGARTDGALVTLCDGIDRQVADLAGLARHARTLTPAVQ